MYKAFLEASPKAKAAAICFLAGKLMFIMTGVCMFIGDLATIIAISIYALLILSTIALCLWESFGGREKTYKELEQEIKELKKMLDTEE